MKLELAYVPFALCSLVCNAWWFGDNTPDLANLRRNGAKVEAIRKGANEVVVGISLASYLKAFTDKDLVPFLDFSSLTKLNLAGTSISDDAGLTLSSVALHELILNHTRISDRFFFGYQNTKLTSLRLGYTEVSDKAMIALVKNVNLEKLDVTATKVARIPMQHFMNLRILLASGSCLVDDCFRAKSKLRLRVLELADTRIKGELLRHLSEDDLEILDLSGTSLEEMHLGNLSKFRGLRELYLRRCKVGDAVGGIIDGHKKLTTVYLDGTRITDKCVARLRRLPRLEVLGLNDCDITDEACRNLGAMKTLKVLHLTKSQVSDIGLLQLGNLVDLEILSVKGSKATLEGVRELRKKLPKLKIVDIEFD